MAEDYSLSQEYKDQKELLAKIEKIYKKDKYSAKKKVKLFTSEVCLPEIIAQEQKLQKQRNEEDPDAESSQLGAYLSSSNEQDRAVIPFVCFYDALSFLKRLPTLEEISDQDKRIDLLEGYRTKDNFISIKDEDQPFNEDHCQTNLQALYEE